MRILVIGLAVVLSACQQVQKEEVTGDSLQTYGEPLNAHDEVSLDQTYQACKDGDGWCTPEHYNRLCLEGDKRMCADENERKIEESLDSLNEMCADGHKAAC